MSGDDYLWAGPAKATAATDRALLVLVEGKSFWLPQKLIHDDSEVWRKGDEGDLVIPQWLAEAKGIC